jgi:hypothetical protein
MINKLPIKVGDIIVNIEGMQKGSEEIIFTLSTGIKYKMYHDQDCCERVELEDVVGDFIDLLNSPLIISESSNNCGENEYQRYTYTYYKFATIKGYVDLRWYGISNGYYSERVDWELLND